jgi:hypothetical protein
MSQAYSNPDREDDPYALPDVEVFYADNITNEEGKPLEAGWYWWACFPGCLPDGDPSGPFATEAEALADAELED